MAHILLVEDEQFVSDVLASAMKKMGHIVVKAANGVDGLKRFTEQRFDLVITDLIMPEKPGIEMILEMRRHEPDAKIIVITGGGHIGSIDFPSIAEDVGVMATFIKPFSLAKFLIVLDECLRTPLNVRPPADRK
jgi:DNA-binding NtrC family response regulator